MGIYLKIKQVCICAFFFMLRLTSTRLLDLGNESQAVVEFAPYQKLPLEKKKVDSRNATIEQGML